MDNIVYEILNKYFIHITNVGYINNKNLYKVLFMLIISDFMKRDSNNLITENDYKSINKAIYKLFGTTCLISYPEYCKTKSERIMYIGSISELASRLDTIEDRQDNAVTADTATVETVDDIVTST